MAPLTLEILCLGVESGERRGGVPCLFEGNLGTFAMTQSQGQREKGKLLV